MTRWCPGCHVWLVLPFRWKRAYWGHIRQEHPEIARRMASYRAEMEGIPT